MFELMVIRTQHSAICKVKLFADMQIFRCRKGPTCISRNEAMQRPRGVQLRALDHHLMSLVNISQGHSRRQQVAILPFHGQGAPRTYNGYLNCSQQTRGHTVRSSLLSVRNTTAFMSSHSCSFPATTSPRELKATQA